MIITLHTPQGVVPIDTDTITDEGLEALGLSREWLNTEYIDLFRARELLANSPDVITQPEMWELLRILGRHFGWC